MDAEEFDGGGGLAPTVGGGDAGPPAEDDPPEALDPLGLGDGPTGGEVLGPPPPPVSEEAEDRDEAEDL